MILGATGSLGGYLACAFANRYTVVCPKPRHVLGAPLSGRMEQTEAPLSVRNPAPQIAAARADAVVNCVAVTPSRRDGNEPERVDVNGRFPHRLAAACRDVGAYLVHISTDAVFSGRRGAYSERDAPDPTDVYGASKLLGEVARPGCLTLRTTFFGASPTGAGLANWLLRQRSGSIHGYENYRFSGLWMGTLARAIAAVIDRPDRPHGVYHAGGEPISKLRLLEAINESLRLGVRITPQPEPICDRSLDSTRLWSLLGQPRPRFEAMLAEMLPELMAAQKAEKPAPQRQSDGHQRAA